MPRWPDLTVVERLNLRIVKGPADQCWSWIGTMSPSRFRGKAVTRYPNFAVNGWFKIRVNRLLLILRDGPLDVPPEEGETFPRWLRRANRFYKFRQSAHSCDNCECVNLGHLEWKTQAENLQEQADRKRAGESREEGHAA